jgi:hypothetical protein
MMRFAGELPQAIDRDPTIASDYADRLRHRQEAKILYDMIIKGELGDPKQYQDQLKRLMDQISGVDLKGV